MGQSLVYQQQQHQGEHRTLSDDESNPDLENQSENGGADVSGNANVANEHGAEGTAAGTVAAVDNDGGTNHHHHPQLLFGGAPMIIDGLLNQDFFSNNNSEELMNLFGYYGGVEGLLGTSENTTTLGGNGGDQPTFRKFEFKETMLLRNDVNIQKNSISLLKSNNQENHYQLSFKFNVRSSFIEECKVFVYLKAREICIDGRVAYVSVMSREIPAKSFCQQDFVTQNGNDDNTQETRVDLNSGNSSQDNTRRDYHESVFVEYTLNDIIIDFKHEFPNREDLQYTNIPQVQEDDDTEMQSQLIPLVIVLSCDTSTQYSLCSLEPQSNDQSYSIKVNKQKIVVGQELYEVGEIYQQATNDHHHEEEENLCVVCMSEEANIVVLPCGHMSLCESCATALKEQTNKCPICRQKVESAIKLPSKEE